MDDRIIVKQITRKKDIGLEMLIDHYAGLITAIVRKHLSGLNMYEEECINDVLLSVWNNIESFDQKQNSFKNWIGAIAKYKAIDYKRKYMKERKNISLSQVDPPASADSLLLQHELQEEIEELLSHLNEKDRHLFKQYYLEDVRLEKIASHTQTTKDNLYNRLSRGRKN
ncbi:sigma-70 family RNA polymerase sigma factor [Bacillus sp. PK3_68]|uniref:sigma-70 family RNA polymerase sigma factor n=1 Tax=Bacillus sp. PK3_68 TaxID=2027408 RepID=UPI000E7429F2|nr:sigma-70 family RNA polymerase sigma factor [Bacillus sp. PK3_68]RJS61786.1 RNA polymerase subunit sigma-70 [Bacillus sp. PK3_68]